MRFANGRRIVDQSVKRHNYSNNNNNGPGFDWHSNIKSIFGFYLKTDWISSRNAYIARVKFSCGYLLFIVNKPWNSKQTFDRIRLSFVLYFYILIIYLYQMLLWRMNFIIDFISWYNILLVSIIYVMMYTAVDTDCLTGWLKAKVFL